MNNKMKNIMNNKMKNIIHKNLVKNKIIPILKGIKKTPKYQTRKVIHKVVFYNKINLIIQFQITPFVPCLIIFYILERYFEYNFLNLSFRICIN